MRGRACSRVRRSPTHRTATVQPHSQSTDRSPQSTEYQLKPALMASQEEEKEIEVAMEAVHRADRTAP
eukprot:1619454-Pleurochrysis_carterae.AAC.2